MFERYSIDGGPFRRYWYEVDHQKKIAYVCGTSGINNNHLYRESVDYEYAVKKIESERIIKSWYKKENAT